MTGPSTLWLLPALAAFFSFYEGDSLDQPVAEAPAVLEEYDYIVVGGGSSGSVVAARLSEDPEVTVLLLEAGGQETEFSEVPGLAVYLQLSQMDWQYKAEPSTTSCLAMVSNRCNLPRGKVIGGSSSINYMLYVRGNRQDYDLWEAQGNRGWGYDHVLPFFKYSEDNSNPTLATNSDFHGSGGPLSVGEPPWRSPLAAAFVEAGVELGYPARDFNGAQQTGFMVPQGFLRRGSRCSNARAYLRPARRRPNLHTALHAFATRILFDSARRAYGVVFDRGGEEQRGQEVRARREVILAAGAINTPQLLMLSGVGPAQHLRRHNISVVADLAVGRNLQDHVAGTAIFTIEQPVSLLYSRLENLPAVLKYSVFGSGPLTSLGGVEGVAFVSTRFTNASRDWPDIEFHFVSGSHASDGGSHLRHALGLQEEYWTHYFSRLVDRDHFSILAKLMRPRSRGVVELRSDDPYEYPKITTNFLSERADLMVIKEGLKIARQVGDTQVFREFGARLFDLPLPGCESFEWLSEAYWECYIRHLTFTIYHYSGTAKMGPYWDPHAVVDPMLRVYGVQGLRVVDASIFPTIPSGNTNAPVTMVAEKAAHMIKEYWASARTSAGDGARPYTTLHSEEL
ncbi:glucose dehydrogenase [FAD, quinone]-like [Penaeus japonicus]|uniref:glucose dehydrogenase [FAD, quinone]-like n=1 Tax=Penaeus japonicus TaxID=27405 RepID=UPI001C7167DE|nr:glucose dehydrogenase [FAD, quinone]-like [Penaeus japonicus]XP_042883200.1 glucose dehydrogenase [FAD, quinone]-like [Penaeus japonicus]